MCNTVQIAHPHIARFENYCQWCEPLVLHRRDSHRVPDSSRKSSAILACHAIKFGLLLRGLALQYAVVRCHMASNSGRVMRATKLGRHQSMSNTTWMSLLAHNPEWLMVGLTILSREKSPPPKTTQPNKPNWKQFGGQTVCPNSYCPPIVDSKGKREDSLHEQPRKLFTQTLFIGVGGFGGGLPSLDLWSPWPPRSPETPKN